ncbi:MULTISPECIES: hypothetical protein [Acinetobacter]|uniref:Uncharacterized protein n=1 Tax=Acinetobacter johnsonii TaxID=40214 RepID=A0AAJ6IEC0_ACIJO|nr:MULTISPECIES: hypothetical protein [Acinetobacter]ALV71654.1 hypothetical protein RZ95_01175 [Acinetobacter johnsonii XBB1]MDH1532726.1 hypothetical protein [Acinetobacter johnsonii]WMG19064.1 hypothetical protein QBJ73_05685 [Acinetobacter johnsonii]
MEKMTQTMTQLKDTLVQKTLDSLLHEGQSLFDLTTADGIKNAVHYFIEYHFQQVIESGQYRIANAEDHRVDNGELI